MATFILLYDEKNTKNVIIAIFIVKVVIIYAHKKCYGFQNLREKLFLTVRNTVQKSYDFHFFLFSYYSILKMEK